MLSEREPALGLAVLKRDAAVFLKHGVGRGLDIVNGEKLRRGETAREGDDFGLLRELEQLTDIGDLHSVHSVRKVDHR